MPKNTLKAGRWLGSEYTGAELGVAFMNELVGVKLAPMLREWDSVRPSFINNNNNNNDDDDDDYISNNHKNNVKCIWQISYDLHVILFI